MFNRQKFHEKFANGATKLKPNCWRVNGGVTLYETRVVDTSNGQIRLFTGGYRTQSTKSVINEVLKALGKKAHIFQKNFVWYVAGDCGHVTEFTEGISV